MFDYFKAAAENRKKADIYARRATKNWVRNGPGDEEMSRRYWGMVDKLRTEAESYERMGRALTAQKGKKS